MGTFGLCRPGRQVSQPMRGLVMAAQLLLGRYTGYRLTELFRFRGFLRDDAPLAA